MSVARGQGQSIWKAGQALTLREDLGLRTDVFFEYNSKKRIDFLGEHTCHVQKPAFRMKQLETTAREEVSPKLLEGGKLLGDKAVFDKLLLQMGQYGISAGRLKAMPLGGHVPHEQHC